MQYELYYENNKGVLTDRTPILRDVKDTFSVSFCLPDDGAYVALFKGEDGIEHRKIIKDGVCVFPKKLLEKEQYVELIVCRINDDRIVYSWECEPLKITTFFYLRRTQWQISGGMTDKDCLERLAELERKYAEVMHEQTMKDENERQRSVEEKLRLEECRKELEACGKRYDTIFDRLSTLTERYNGAVEKYNAAVETINKLAERVTALENNYDPTIIE